MLEKLVHGEQCLGQEILKSVLHMTCLAYPFSDDEFEQDWRIDYVGKE
jgi:hypothetical protein